MSYVTKRKIAKNVIDDFIDNTLEIIMEQTRKIGTEQFQNKNLQDPWS